MDWKQAKFNWSIGPKSFQLDVKLFRLVDNGRQNAIECNKLILAAGAAWGLANP